MDQNRKRSRKSKNASSPQKWIIIGGTIIVIAAVLFGTYYMVSNKADSSYISYVKSLKEKVDKANEANAEVLAGIEDLDYKNTSELNRIMNEVAKNNKSIQSVIEEINKYNPIEKYKTHFDALENGVAANKQIYDQVYNILKSPVNKNLEGAINDLQGYIDTANKNYGSSQIKNISLALPNEILSLPGNISSFASKAINDNEARLTLLEKYNSYFTSMDSVIDEFEKSMVNFDSHISQMESGSKTVGDVRIDMDKKLVEISSIDSAYDKITPPEKLASKFKNFDKIMKSYFTYVQEYKQLLITIEEAGADEDGLNSIADEIGQMDVRYEEISNSLDKYLKEYTDDKFFYQDPNNL